MSSLDVNEKELMLSHIANLEKQVRSFSKELRALKARIQSLPTKPKKKLPLASLKGSTKG